MKKHLLIVLLMLSLALFAACGGDKAEALTQELSSENGYSFAVPASWQAEADGYDFVCSGLDGAVYLISRSELGGNNYYTLEEMADKLAAGADELGELETAATPLSGRDRLWRSYKGAGEARVDVFICQPGAGVRFYLLFAVEEDGYASLKPQIESIIKSFSLDLSEVEYYQLLDERRAEQADAA